VQAFYLAWYRVIEDVAVSDIRHFPPQQVDGAVYNPG
jgi:hypothetical protein